MKLVNENISIEEFDTKEYQISLVETIEDEKAILTHYLHNIYNGVSKHYEKDAKNIIKKYIDFKNNNNISLSQNEALAQLLFEVKNVPFPGQQNNSFKFIDLFAGIGGFRIAMQNVGGKCIYTSEWNKDAQKTYRENFGEVPFGDITKESVKNNIPKEFDVLCAGFPCQAFSIAGHRKGFSDTRGTLFFDFEQLNLVA